MSSPHVTSKLFLNRERQHTIIYDTLELIKLRERFRNEICFAHSCQICHNNWVEGPQSKYCNFESQMFANPELKLFFFFVSVRPDFFLNEKELFTLMFAYPKLVSEYMKVKVFIERTRWFEAPDMKHSERSELC